MGAFQYSTSPGGADVQVTTPTIEDQILAEQWNVFVLLIGRGLEIQALESGIDEDLSTNLGEIRTVHKLLTKDCCHGPAHTVTTDYDPAGSTPYVFKDFKKWIVPTMQSVTITGNLCLGIMRYLKRNQGIRSLHSPP